MDKQLVLEQAKSEMKAIINGLELENIEDSKERLDKYFEFVEVLSSLYVTEANKENEQRDEIEAESNNLVKIEQQKETMEVIETLDTDKQMRFIFERKLRGGLLADLDGGYFIPEIMVRDLGVANGDILEIIDTRPCGEQSRYTFRIVERGDGIDPEDRVEFKYCIIERIGSFMCVRKLASGEDLKYNGLPYSFVLKDQDVLDMRLAEKDIVDVAFYLSRPDTIRVMWKHDSSAIVQNRQVKPTKKEIKEVPKQEKDLPIDNPKLFNGKRILVVGAKPKEAGYKAILEALGSEVEVYAGTEAKSRTRGAIQRSDVVVMVTAYLGHGKSSGSPQVVEMCKKAKVPFGFVDTMGNESFVRGVEEVLKRKEESVTVS